MRAWSIKFSEDRSKINKSSENTEEAAIEEAVGVHPGVAFMLHSDAMEAT